MQSGCTKECGTEVQRVQIFDAALRQNAFLVGVLHFAHLGDGVGKLDQRGVRVAAGQDHVHHLRAVAQGLGHLGGVEHAVADGVVDLVEHHHVPLAGEDRLARLGPGGLHHADVFRIGLGAADLHKSAAHLLQHEVLAEGLGRVQLAVVPRALEELQHQHAHAVADRAQGRAHGGGGFAFAGAGVDQDQSASGRLFRVHKQF